MLISLTFSLIEIKESVLSLNSISPFAHFAESSFAKADTGTPSILFNASATLIAVVLFVSIGDIVSLLYIFILSYSMDNYNKFILIPKLSKKQFIVNTTVYLLWC